MKFKGDKQHESIYDIDKILTQQNVDNQEYESSIIEDLINIGIKDIKCTDDFRKLSESEILHYKKIIQDEIVYLDSNQLAMKYLMNSMYGGASHVSFYWYNINLANDITGECRN